MLSREFSPIISKASIEKALSQVLKVYINDQEILEGLLKYWALQFST
jgi:hypothetical protein